MRFAGRSTILSHHCGLHPGYWNSIRLTERMVAVHAFHHAFSFARLIPANSIRMTIRVRTAVQNSSGLAIPAADRVPIVSFATTRTRLLRLVILERYILEPCRLINGSCRL